MLLCAARIQIGDKAVERRFFEARTLMRANRASTALREPTLCGEIELQFRQRLRRRLFVSDHDTPVEQRNPRTDLRNMAEIVARNDHRCSGSR